MPAIFGSKASRNPPGQNHQRVACLPRLDLEIGHGRALRGDEALLLGEIERRRGAHLDAATIDGERPFGRGHALAGDADALARRPDPEPGVGDGRRRGQAHRVALDRRRRRARRLRGRERPEPTGEIDRPRAGETELIGVGDARPERRRPRRTRAGRNRAPHLARRADARPERGAGAGEFRFGLGDPRGRGRDVEIVGVGERGEPNELRRTEQRDPVRSDFATAPRVRLGVSRRHLGGEIGRDRQLAATRTREGPDEKGRRRAAATSAGADRPVPALPDCHSRSSREPRRT